MQISFSIFSFLPSNHLAILRFLASNHLVKLLKDRFLKKMLFKNQNPVGFFSRKTLGANNSFTLIENNFRFLRGYCTSYPKKLQN